MAGSGPHGGPCLATGLSEEGGPPFLVPPKLPKPVTPVISLQFSSIVSVCMLPFRPRATPHVIFYFICFLLGPSTSLKQPGIAPCITPSC